MADAIAGPRTVMLSTDDASRRALRTVGKVAATTGNTIHLDRAAIQSNRIDEVMAHELTHVAHASPKPRFFDDIDDSPEERRAEHVARVMARSTIAPTASTMASPVLRRAATSTSTSTGTSATTSSSALSAGRSPTSFNSSSVIDAASLANAITGGSGSTATLQNSIRRAPIAHQPDIVRRSIDVDSTGTSATGEQTSARWDPHSHAAKEWFVEELQRNIDVILRRVEDQMIIELERRGGRMWGGI